jgi:hypothetical protein
MKLETLVKRYATLGYEPKNLSRDEEVFHICKWMYDTYGVWVGEHYCSMRFDHYMKFTGFYIYYTGQDHAHTHYCDNHFTNPFDAKYDALRKMLPGFKSQVEYGGLKNNL